VRARLARFVRDSCAIDRFQTAREVDHRARAVM
jgi:hypothetical protein